MARTNYRVNEMSHHSRVAWGPGHVVRPGSRCAARVSNLTARWPGREEEISFSTIITLSLVADLGTSVLCTIESRTV